MSHSLEFKEVKIHSNLTPGKANVMKSESTQISSVDQNMVSRASKLVIFRPKRCNFCGYKLIFISKAGQSINCQKVSSK